MAEQGTVVLGIVGIKNMGVYSSGTNYEKLNVVTYQGSTYCALKNTKGNLPTDTNYWQLYAEKGGVGPQGPQGPQGPVPVKGVDYWTQQDQTEIAQDIQEEVSDQLSDLTSATPLAANSVSEMTDTTRIYVNVSDGHWYWYNGTNWIDGGIYQATQSSLSDNLINFLNNNTMQLNGAIFSNLISGSEQDIAVDSLKTYLLSIYNLSNTDAQILIRERTDSHSANGETYYTVNSYSTLNVKFKTKSNTAYIRAGRNNSNEPIYGLVISDYDKYVVNQKELNKVNKYIGVVNFETFQGNLGSTINTKKTVFNSTTAIYIENIFNDVTITTKDNYCIRGVYYYDSNDILIRADVSGVDNVIKTLTTNAIGTSNISQIRIVLRKEDNSDISPNDIDNALKYFYYTNSLTEEIMILKNNSQDGSSNYTFNIMDYGADNTGQTNISTILQSLIDNVMNLGKVEIYFPQGSYLISNTIRHKIGDIIFNLAPNATIISNANPTYTTSQLAGSTTPCYSLGSLSIYGGKWTTNREVNLVEDFRRTGLQLTKLSYVNIVNSHFEELTQSNHLFDISGTKNVLIKNCIFNGMFFNDTQLPTNSNGNFELIQIDIGGGIDHNLSVADNYNDSTKNVEIKNCIFIPSNKQYSYMYRPIGLHYAGATIENIADWYDNIKIINNTFYNVLGRAIEISCMTNAIINGNHFNFDDDFNLIDDVIKGGDIRWSNTAYWATFNGISDRLRYNSRNIEICDNDLSYNGTSNVNFISLFNNGLDTSNMYKDSNNNSIQYMGKNFIVNNNSGDLNIVVKYIDNLILKYNDVPNIVNTNNNHVDTNI